MAEGGGEATATAAVLVIGDEILSGRTHDTNTRDIARAFAARGVDLKEARVVPDVHEEIVRALNALRARYSYVVTTGGIGPTHDDITADAVAAAFGAPLHEDPEIIEELTRRSGEPPNAARRRMARLPEGAVKVRNPVSGPPGFMIGNVFVLAGVPSIMRGMLEDVVARLEGGAVVVSRTLRVEGTPESVLAAPLEGVARAHRRLSLGSYPFQLEGGGYGANLVVRGRDPAEVEASLLELEAALAGAGIAGARRVDE
jgi:molybdenum cofactor synthesis domain-containing protein